MSHRRLNHEPAPEQQFQVGTSVIPPVVIDVVDLSSWWYWEAVQIHPQLFVEVFRLLAHWWPSTGTQEVGTQPCSEEHNLSSTYPAGPCPHEPTTQPVGHQQSNLDTTEKSTSFQPMMTPVYFESIICLLFLSAFFIYWYPGTIRHRQQAEQGFLFGLIPVSRSDLWLRFQLVNACVCFCLAKCNKNKHLLSFDRFRWMLIFRWRTSTTLVCQCVVKIRTKVSNPWDEQ